MSLPLTLHLDGRVVLLVGGGSVAHRKATTLFEAGAAVRVVSPQIEPELRGELASRGAELRERPFRSEDLDGAALAIAATSNDAVNAQIVSEARARHILVCDASDGRRGDVTMQAIVRIGELTFTIDTGGASPAFAARIARELRERFGEGYAGAARTLARMRAYVKAVLPRAQRGAVLRSLAETPIERLATLDPAEAEHEVEETIEHLRGSHDRSAPAAVVCASRASKLAMIQSRGVAAKLAQTGTATTILNVATTGDRAQDRPISALGSENVFVQELELALRERRADYAVHSCKDLPSDLAADMRIAAISAREDARDAFCSESFPDFWKLPPGARVGTSSARRRTQLLALRADLSYVDIRGNVDTRLRKLREHEYDAIVLAMAGLRRLGLEARFTVPFDVDQLVPAVAQGALAAETRAEDEVLASRLREAINDPRSEVCVLAERAALRALRGGCQSPIGIHARLGDGDELHIRGVVLSFDGARVVSASRSGIVRDGERAAVLGAALAAALRIAGCDALLEKTPLRGRVVLLPRTQDRPSRIAAALRASGAEVRELRAGKAAAASSGEPPPDMIVFPSSGSVTVALTHLDALRSAPPVVVAMGPASSAAARAAGFVPDLISPEASIESLVDLVCTYFRDRTPEPTHP